MLLYKLEVVLVRLTSADFQGHKLDKSGTLCGCMTSESDVHVVGARETQC